MHYKGSRIEDLSETDDNLKTIVTLRYTDNGVEKSFEAIGNGPIDAVQRGFQKELHMKIKVLDYTEHALNAGSNAQAAAYIHLMDEEKKVTTYGVGISSNITRASIRAIFSAINRIRQN